MSVWHDIPWGDTDKCLPTPDRAPMTKQSACHQRLTWGTNEFIGLIYTTQVRGVTPKEKSLTSELMTTS